MMRRVHRSQSAPDDAPVRRYTWTLVALLGLLILTAVCGRMKLGTLNIVLSLSISIAKTILVMAIFMHEAEERRLIRLVSAVGFAWLAILIGLALSDYLTRIAVPAPW